MGTYTVAKQLKAFLESKGMTQSEAQGDPRCRALLQGKAQEDARNIEEFEQSMGRDVRYGMVVQLQHDTSHKFLAVTRESAEINKDGRKVVLDNNAGEASWFKIMPRLRVHSEGEKVHMDDPVILESEESGLKLSADTGSGYLSDGRREISAASSGASTFKLDTYRSFEMTRTKSSILMGGQAVRLIHKEAEGLLCSDYRTELGKQSVVSGKLSIMGSQ